jgi:hypothetical protein
MRIKCKKDEILNESQSWLSTTQSADKISEGCNDDFIYTAKWDGKNKQKGFNTQFSCFFWYSWENIYSIK